MDRRDGARSGRKLLAIGLDAGDYDFISARRNDLPALAKLLDAGSVHRPDGPDALSGAVWPTFYQGKHPGHHGAYQHLVWDADRMGLKLIQTAWLPYRPFWQDLEENGLDVVVVDVPYSFPTALKNGVVVTDWGTHGQTHPTASNRPEVMRVLQRFGRSPIGRETPIAKTPAQLQALRVSLVDAARRKGALTRQLMVDLKWDVFLTVFGETHRAGHMYFCDDDLQDAPIEKQKTPLLEIYKTVDKEISQTLANIDGRTDVLLFSVHGMTKNWTQEHVAAEVLRRVNELFLTGTISAKPRSPTGQRGGVLGKVRGMVPNRAQYAVGAAAPDWFRRWVVERDVVGGLDWQRTPGFLLRGDIRTEIRLNLRGRETQGILEPQSEEHRRYVALLREVFEGLVDTDTGKPVVSRFVDIHNTFPGGFVDGLPDYVVSWQPAPPASRVHTPLLGAMTMDQPGVRGGDHIDVGFAAVAIGADNDDLALPPLRDTHDFAAFIGALALGQTARRPVPQPA